MKCIICNPSFEENSMTSLSPTSLDLTQDNLEQLKALFPNVFTEGKIDFDALKAELGEHMEVEGERYQFTWNGKAQAKRIATTPSMGTLRPAVEESVNWDTTENLYIEGDNLEVLKLLQKAYFGKVKMIYIDPPYNTGKDFVYKDDFKDNLSNYKRLTNQVDEQGNPLTTNSDSSGRYHSNWLNMMYPRLKLARNLLRDDGVIFISIDDNEVHNLRKLCDEIFGEGNFVDSIIWKKRYGGGAKEKYLVSLHETTLMYAKNELFLESIYIPLTEESISRYYTQKDANFEKRGPYRTHPLEATKSMGERKNLVYSIPGPNGVEILPKRQWLWAKERALEAAKNGELEFIKNNDNQWTVHSKQYLIEESGEIRKGKAFSIIEDVYTQHGTNEIIDIFGNAQIFSFPKPINFVKKILSLGLQHNDIILDFFSGSATTAHAVMQLNAEDGGNRKFILVQIPEATPEGSEARKAGYATIAEIGKERIRRAGKKIQETLLSKPPRQASPATPPTEGNGGQTDLLLNSPPSEGYAEGGGWCDCGFKVFKLDTSNIKTWNPTPETLQDDLLNAVDNILADRTDEDLLYEVLIKYGLPLTLPVETIQLGQQTGFSVGMGSLIACFAQGITLETVQAIANLSTPENPILRVVFRDSSFADDNVKTNAVQRLKQAGIEDVVSV